MWLILTFIINEIYLWLQIVELKMKIIFKIIAPLVLGLLPGAAHAYVWFTQESLLASFFPGVETVATAWIPTAEERASLAQKLGYVPAAASYTFFQDAGAAPSAYALIDEQKGQHEPITFGVKLLPDATIDRIEVMVYREAYGDGVRAETFRKQFSGLSFSNPMRAGKEIRIVSGATISTRALAVGARRASALLATWLAGSATRSQIPMGPL